MSQLIEKKEMKYAIIGIIFLISWFMFLRDLIAPIFQGMFPFIAMIIYSAGLFVGLLFLSELLKHNNYRYRILIISFCVIIGIGIISAPYLISKAGEINMTAAYWYVSADVGFASLWALFIPKTAIWFMTYVISPALMIFIIPIFIGTSKQIASVIK